MIPAQDEEIRRLQQQVRSFEHQLAEQHRAEQRRQARDAAAGVLVASSSLIDAAPGSSTASAAH